jgi:hypothetical protein
MRGQLQAEFDYEQIWRPRRVIDAACRERDVFNPWLWGGIREDTKRHVIWRKAVFAIAHRPTRLIPMDIVFTVAQADRFNQLTKSSLLFLHTFLCEQRDSLVCVWTLPPAKHRQTALSLC